MRCAGCGSVSVTERLERRAQGYRRFRCRGCGKLRPFSSQQCSNQLLGANCGGPAMVMGASNAPWWLSLGDKPGVVYLTTDAMTSIKPRQAANI